MVRVKAEYFNAIDKATGEAKEIQDKRKEENKYEYIK